MTTAFAALLQAFFADRLIRERRVSHHTIAAYRDCFRILFEFAKLRLAKAPSVLRLEDLDAPFLVDFLHHLETERHNSARSRNARLAALHSFFTYVALRERAYAHQCQRILAIPSKRQEKRPIDFLRPEEIDALLGIIDRSTWIGRRDRTLLAVAIQTAPRSSVCRCARPQRCKDDLTASQRDELRSAQAAPIEYVILRKLEYFDEGGSEKHLRDIRSMLDVSGSSIDRTFVDEQIAQRGLQRAWADCSAIYIVIH